MFHAANAFRQKSHLTRGFVVLITGCLLLSTAWITVARLRLSLCHSRYTLLNPLRRCSDGNEMKREYEAFRDELLLWTEQQKMNGAITHASIYFRDLDGGPWFGINEEEKFSAASLLKVPIMMAVLRQAETHPEILTQELGYSGTLEGQPNIFDPSKTVLPGEYLSVEELLRRMIVYSDNSSKELLKARLLSLNEQNDLLAQTYHDLGIFALPNSSIDNFITVKTYSSIFRLLFNASYLSKEMSQKALELLSAAEFRDGLVGGLPTAITIAHKFGVRELPDQEQLHDCGIVFHPQTPYLICVMTRGKDLNMLANVIRDISRKVYQEVDVRN
ncbi:serine hydrolase [Candidatus Uhrbacteria bacterium]|nr:serine hydrolase [Candidatus Uhrbacteria bacterium]